jgi:DNA-binding beta-propeller fold protein YncE
MRLTLSPTRVSRALWALTLTAALAAPASALAAPKPQPAHAPVMALGTLAQLAGPSGCLVDRSKPRKACALVRGLAGPAPILGSHAVALSPNGRNLYVASSRSNAIAVFKRNAATGKLTQGSGAAGCIAARAANGCARAFGLLVPNSVAVSPDGRNVYATSLASNAIAIFRRNPSTGALSQAGNGTGCVSNTAIPGCTTGRALAGPDVAAVSPDGKNVYVGSFTGNAVAVFSRNSSTGALTQPADATGCITNVPTAVCTTGLALASPEGLAVSGDGNNVYVAAPGSSALDVFTRNPSTGALTQPTDGTGCITEAPLTGCVTGTELGEADAVAVSPDDADVYVTSLLSNSVTSFTRTATTGQLAQQSGTAACTINTLAVGCSLGRAMSDAEGLAVSPDGASLYVVAFASGAIDVLNRNADSGVLVQKPRIAGCVTSTATPDCAPARGLLGASSVAVSPDGKYVYSASFVSNSVGVFKRVTKAMTRARGT